MNCERCRDFHEIKKLNEFYREWLGPYIIGARNKEIRRKIHLAAQTKKLHRLLLKQYWYEMLAAVLGPLSFFAVIFIPLDVTALWLDLVLIAIVQGFILLLLQNKRLRKHFWQSLIY